MTLADFPPSLVRLCAVLFGLVWGSFLNVVIYRVPRRMSIVRPASHCPACGAPIRAHDNLPIVSWVLLRGRARCCGKPISARYPLVEAIAGVLSIAIVEVIILPLPGATPAGHALALYLADLALALGLTAAAFIDLEFMIVPDSISLGGTIVGLLTFSLRDLRIEQALSGGAIGFVIVWLPFVWGYAKLRGRPGMGLGDAKLLMLAGAWFGVTGALLVLGAAAVQGAVAAFTVLLVKGRIEEPDAVQQERAERQQELASLPSAERAELESELQADPLAEPPDAGWRKARIAFGPFLILATLEVLLLGPDRIMDWMLL